MVSFSDRADSGQQMADSGQQAGNELAERAGEIEVRGMLLAVRMLKLIKDEAKASQMTVDQKVLLLTVAVTETVTSMLYVQMDHSVELARNVANGLTRVIRAVVDQDELLSDMIKDEMTQDVVDDAANAGNIAGKLLAMLQIVLERYDDVMGDERIRQIRELIAEAKDKGVNNG